MSTITYICGTNLNFPRKDQRLGRKSGIDWISNCDSNRNRASLYLGLGSSPMKVPPPLPNELWSWLAEFGCPDRFNDSMTINRSLRDFRSKMMDTEKGHVPRRRPT